MASISKEPGGKRTIQFVGGDGKRRSIRLGKVPQRAAEAVKLRVEQLAFASISVHAPDDETARWLASLDSVMLDKLAAVGLVAKREQDRPTPLQDYLDSYVAGRPDVKPSTRIVFGHTTRNLIAYFGAAKPLRDITAGDADAWRIWLAQQEKLADNTVRRRCGIAKQFFRAAHRHKLIAENPFCDLVAQVKANKKRSYFITREEAEKVIAACPDAQWRLLFALSRYAGLRCPSEHLALRWQDINWADGRMTVHSPKTEHHEGGECRGVPIFPELRPYLEEVFELAEPGTEFVITRYRKTNANLRTRLTKIIRRAGLKPWPKLFHNLRATCETELAATHPMYKVCKWIGNSLAVADKHYLQVTDADYRQAAEPLKAVRNPVQHDAALPRFTSQLESDDAGEMAFCTAILDDAKPCEYFADSKLGGTGLEPVTSTV